MNPLWSDILAQGTNIQHVRDHLFGSERARLEAAARFVRPEKPILLIGIASASYLCIPAQIQLSEAGYITRVMNAADALYHEWPALSRANIVINSRSGETAEVVKLAKRLKDSSIPFLAITNEPESNLAQLTPHILWVNTRKDDLVSINVVSGMMLATLVWAAAVRDRLDQILPYLENLPEAMEETIRQTTLIAGSMAAILSDIRPIHLLARGASQGSALCGRLVLEEVARHPAVALEAAEFRQGPNEVIEESFGTLLFTGHGGTVDLTRALAQEIYRHGGKLVALGSAEAVQGLPGLVFPLPTVPVVFAPLLEIVPVQGLAYRIAEQKGIEPGTVRYITKVIREEAETKRNG